MFWVHIKSANMPRMAGAWVPPGGRRTTFVLGWLGMVSCIVAIACSMVPSSSDPHPLAAFFKIIVAAAVMIGVGLLFYWLADRRRKAALVIPQPAE
jgi:hypothetical protein